MQVSNHTSPSIWDEMPITLRQYLFRETFDQLVREDDIPVDASTVFLIHEAVATTLLEHPEVDPDEKRPHKEWRKV